MRQYAEFHQSAGKPHGYNPAGEPVLESIPMGSVDFVLASNSPRRRKLFACTGWTFITRPADLDETVLPGEAPVDYVLRLALEKARAAACAAPAGALVFGSDTTVVYGGQILGKPLHAADAGRMLRQLRGHVHQVLTGLAVLDPASGRVVRDVCASPIEMRAYSDEEIEAYVASGDPLDKAGAYAIQHAGFHPVTQFADCYAGVMGLPLCHLQRLTAAGFGRTPPADVPAACQAELGYACPVFKRIFASPTGADLTGGMLV